VTRWAKARAGSVSNKRWLDELLAPVPGRRPERFADSFVISVMSQNPPRPKKNELRDALLVSLILAVSLFSLAIIVSAHL